MSKEKSELRGRKTGKQKAAGSMRVSELGQKRLRESETKGE